MIGIMVVPRRRRDAAVSMRRVWGVVISASLVVSFAGMVGAEEKAGASMPAQQEEAAASVAPVDSAAAAPAGTISVDFKEADIRQVLRVISLKSGVDIVAGPNVEGVVTIKLTNVPWEQALDTILRTYGFAYERTNNVIRVMTQDEVEQQALAIEVFPLSYAKAAQVNDVVKDMLSDRGKTKFDERTNTLIVTDLPSALTKLKQVVARVDRPTPQVRIESRFVETRLSRDENLGINWFDSVDMAVNTAITPTTFPWKAGASLGQIGSTFIPRAGAFDPTTGASLTGGRIPNTGGTFTFGTIDIGTLTTTLNILKQRIDTKVISSPTIVTLDNQLALVQVGSDVSIPNFQVDSSTGRATVTGLSSKSTGIILKVTPHVNPAGEVVLDIAPEITTVGADRTFAAGITFPDFDVQKAQTQVRLTDGETLAIGGLKRKAESVTLDKVPFVGDIPILGWLFTHRRERTPSGQDQLDLLIFMTVNLVKPHGSQTASLPAGS